MSERSFAFLWGYEVGRVHKRGEGERMCESGEKERDRDKESKE